MLNTLKNFKNSHAVKRLSAKGAGVLERLMPSMIETIKVIDNKDETLTRVVVLFEAVAGRNVYLSLLAENTQALLSLVSPIKYL